MNNLQKLAQLGQSIWYDNINRRIITSGELKKMVDGGCLGVTSNPTIFDKAISGSTDYDLQIRDLVEQKPDIDAAELIQALMVTDIQMACDVLAPVYERTRGRDGYVSVEVTPSKARKTQATMEEVRELWSKIDRKNLMVKIPATKEGLPAIEQMISEGRNINVTLIFSVARYREVAEAYLKGLERRAAEGKPLDHVASVASVFVSRIDTLVDDLLSKNDKAKHLMGRAAVANTKMVYQAFKEIFTSERFSRLRALGAHVQRPLWGSTGTKNPAYSDLLYVDTLIGPDTVNTVPPQTYTAILDHATPIVTVESDLDGARKVLGDLAAAGIDMGWVLQKLEDDGVAAFEKSFDALYANLTHKRNELAGKAVPTV
jgi:transaldolase